MRINGNLVFNTDSTGELQNVYIERLAAAPTFLTGEKGRIYFNTTNSTYFFNDGLQWSPFATGGNAAALQGEVDAIEATLGTLVNGDGTSNVAGALADSVFGGATNLTAALNSLATYVNSNNELSELDDVALTTLSNGQYLKYNSGTSKWYNDTLEVADVTDLTVSAAQINNAAATTSSTAELNVLDGITATTAELNVLDGIPVTLTATELGYVDGVTSPIQAQLDGLQAGDADLAAIAALSGTGIAVRTAADTWSLRSLVAPAAGVTISNADGVVGNPTFALANDLGALESLSGAGYAVRTAADTWETRTINGFAGRTVVTNGDGVLSNTDIDLATVTDAGGGTFLKFTRDTYGRVTGTSAVTQADITGLVDTVYVNAAGDTMTGDLNMGSNFVILANPPTLDTQAANKAYVDAVAAGLSWKQAVNAATTGNITLSGLQTIDGVSLIAGDRVLVKNQTNTAENGIYVVDSGAWTRSTNMDAAGEFLGATVFVLNGTVNDNSGWTQTQTVATVGTDPVLWIQFSGSNTYTWGTGLAATGNTININLGSGIFEQGADAVGIELHNATAGAIILTDDGTTRAVTDSSKLHLLLAASGGLTQDAAGLYIPAAGVTNAMLANSTISINTDTGTTVQALGSTLLINGVATQGVSTAATTGTVTITVADATTSSKGVAQFSSADFNVVAGVVTINSIGNSQLDNSTISFNGTTGGAQPVALGGTLDILGGSAPITTVSSAGTVTINVADATTGAKGLASFDADHFSVAAGAVSLAASLDDLTNVSGVDTAADGSILQKVSGVYNAVSVATLAGQINLTNLGDVTATATDGHALIGTGSGWTNQKIYHTEAFTSATSWTVTHNIGQKFCNVTVVDSTDEVIIPQSIKFDTANQLTVTFTSALAGQVVVMGVQ